MVYEFKCNHCQLEVEEDLTIKEYEAKTAQPIPCEQCQVGELKRVFKPTTFILKGPAWGKNGYNYP
jgi:putative FmdB family regulatory protein